MIITLYKAIGVWLVIVVVAIFNGMFREAVLLPIIGAEIALPLSGILLSVLVFLVTFMSITLFNSPDHKLYILTGLLWILLTLLFEGLFGYYAGEPWQEIVQVFNVKKGDLFILVLFITAISPWVSAKTRGII